MFKSLALAFVAAAGAVPANAATTIYTNAVGGVGAFRLNDSSTYETESYAVTYDNFTLDASKAGTYSVSGATWSGTYYDSTTRRTVFPVPTGRQTFAIGVFASDGALPKVSDGGLGNALFTRYVSVPAIVSGLSQDYAASFSAFTLEAGREYWLAIYAINPIAGDIWLWPGRFTGRNNDPANPTAAQFYDGSVYSIVGAQVFTLVGDAASPPAVPEPASWAMMALGFGLVGAAARRRVRAAA